MRPRRSLSSLHPVLTALILAVAMVDPGLATSVRPMGLGDLVARAEAIVHARALSNRVRTDADTLLHYTITRFEVLDGVKGPLYPGDQFEVEVMGGTAPGHDWTTVVAGAPRFAVNEEVVLFTHPGAGGRRALAGFFQGVLRIMPGPDGGQVLAPPDILPSPRTTVRQVDRHPSPVHRAGRAAAAGASASPVTGRPGRSVRPAVPSSAPPAHPMNVPDLLDHLRRLDARRQDAP
ncbi:MAG: hypothetical protein ACE5IK_06085 [Acidobacteriota bacterium]